MVHQDLRPENIMVDVAGTAKAIDFGSTKVAGGAELEPDFDDVERLGTAQYTAPECLLGDPAMPRSDVFSLGVVAYQMLTGRLPYGADAARLRSRPQQRALRYRPAKGLRPSLPGWIDAALRKAVHPFPSKRHEAVSELAYDLRNPDPASFARAVPLVERDPLLFWKALSLVLALALLCLLAGRAS